MLMEYFFEAVDRAFIEEARRILAQPCLELKTPAGLPRSELGSSPSTVSSGWRKHPERYRQSVQDAKKKVNEKISAFKARHSP
jgi:hypothetical protein